MNSSSAFPKKRLWIPLLLLLLVQSGCILLQEIDSTHSPVFASMIGREYELREEMLAIGIKHQPKFDQVDHIAIMPPPGIYSTYQIVDLGQLRTGTRFKIVGVVTHRSKLFPSTEYVIAVTNHKFSSEGDKPIRIDDVARWRLYIKPATPDEAPQLNPEFFRTL